MAINERKRKEEEDVEKFFEEMWRFFFQNLVKTVDTDPRSSKEETLPKVYQGTSKSDCLKPMIKQKSFKNPD